MSNPYFSSIKPTYLVSLSDVRAHNCMTKSKDHLVFLSCTVVPPCEDTFHLLHSIILLISQLQSCAVRNWCNLQYILVGRTFCHTAVCSYESAIEKM